MHLLLTLMLAASIKEGGAPLRSSCDSDSAAVAELPAGTEITIRYSLSGQRVPCYKVVAKFDGKTADGYLPASAISGLEVFESARKQGGVLGTREVLAAVAPPAASSLRSAA